jgi:hypothetical protein
MTSQSRESRTACRRIRREWETAGKPPCPICDSAIKEGEKNQVDRRWGAVVHRLCAKVEASPPPAALGKCPSRELFGGCPIPFPSPHESFCVCPLLCAVNTIVFARKLGIPRAPIPTQFPGAFGPIATPAGVRAAREAGLGSLYENVPLRESVFYGADRPQMTYAPGVSQAEVWDALSTWYQPPAWVTIDIDSSIREGRVVPASLEQQIPSPEAEER